MFRFVNRSSALAKRAVPVRGFASEKKTFDKILIANRGEIACRVMRSCKKMGIDSVAVYSEPDAQNLHVAIADEAVCVGPAASSQSYLVMDNLIKACKDTGAQAVHPGYGFLSENSEFSKRLHDEGIKFIGPEEYAIVSMGDKIASKKIAREANVNTIPGWLGVIETDEKLLEIANEIGYPVMIKASAGGGGKGMRVAWSDDEAKEGFRLSKQEAMSSFGDDTIFLEKFIEDPRHIEIQVLCDAHGNGIYLNERDCSIQRRNQKVVEEAPSTFLDPETRAKMGEQAVALAKAVQYQSAGTVEFLVDKHRNFYFLEMNTRLQVEHPITELITGVDLVEQMIYVAAGHPLTIKQSDIGIKGWAVESRVYAEDPLNGFLPSIGRLDRYVEPASEEASSRLVRVDSGVREGNEISIYYDPLISKLITYGPTRDAAIDAMRTALDSYVIRGVTSNTNFLRAIMDHPAWLSGDVTTKFIEEYYPEGFQGIEMDKADYDNVISTALVVRRRLLQNQVSISGKSELFDAQEFVHSRMTDLVVTVGGQTYTVAGAESAVEGRNVHLNATITKDGESSSIEAVAGYLRGDDVIDITTGENKSHVQVLSCSDGSSDIVLQYKGTQFKVNVRTAREAQLFEHMPEVEELDTARYVVSPMPGSVFSVNVKVGDKVAPGQEVCVIEAMKMQNAIRAVKGGIVKEVKVEAGQTVAADDLLVEMEPVE